MKWMFQPKKLSLYIVGMLLISFCVLLDAIAAAPKATMKLFATSTSPATNNPTLSFYFQNIDVRSLLQLIAKNSGMNFVVNESVKGNITLNLKDVTWQQALKVILKTQGLSSRRVGNVIYISTIEDIATNEAKQYQSDENIENMSPLKSRLIRLKYASAGNLANVLKGPQGSLLTPRGQVAIDGRTNSLIIRDTQDNLNQVIPELLKLDIPARQVLIEARIVNIDTIYEQELGVRFGTTRAVHLSGTLQAANQMNQGINPANVTNAAGTLDYQQRLNFNVPARTLFDGNFPGSIGLALARVGNVLFDLELSALEGEQHAEVIARPRVITSNQQKALIQTGEEIPYQEATSSGATSVTFKNAVLSLEIVPQITPNNKIVLSIKATEDTRGTNTAVSPTVSIPAINTQAVQSNVLLNDNETIVLGGVYRTNKQNTYDRIPFFGSLPIVGYLFNHTGEHSEKHELLIFITPKIINSDQATKLAETDKHKLEGEG